MTSTIPASASPFQAIDSQLESIYAPIADDLSAVRQLYQQTILESSERRHLHKILVGHKQTAVLSDFHVDIVENISRHLLKTEGKWYRAALTVLAAASFGVRGTEVHQVAASVELVHLATLVHDDIIDNAEMRRGQVSVCNGWGNSVAVLLGDFLLSRAFKLLLASGSVPSQTALTVATGQMCLGEIKQLEQAQLFATTEEEYLEMIGHKTAALMAAATASGGYLAGLDENICGRLDHLGFALGIAFQITDDLLDYRSNLDTMGKDAGGDLRNGKITLPLIHLLRCQPEVRSLLENAADDDSAFVERLCVLMRDNGSYEYAFSLAQRYLDEVRDDLEILRERGADSGCLEAFGAMLEFIVSRNK